MATECAMFSSFRPLDLRGDLARFVDARDVHHLVDRPAVLALQQQRVTVAEAVRRIGLQQIAAAERRHQVERDTQNVGRLRQPCARRHVDDAALPVRRESAAARSARRAGTDPARLSSRCRHAAPLPRTLRGGCSPTSARANRAPRPIAACPNVGLVARPGTRREQTEELRIQIDSAAARGVAFHAVPDVHRHERRHFEGAAAAHLGLLLAVVDAHVG